MLWIEHVLSFVGNIITSLGYWGIAAGMMLESACIPLPSELVLPIAGFMVAGGRINMVLANIFVALGSLAGSLMAYMVGYYGGRPFIIRYGKYFFISEHHFYKADRTFNKYGAATVFLGRLLPVIRTFISLPAGISRMNPLKFLVYSLLGMIPWNFMLIFLGYKFGQNYEQVVRPIFKKYELAVAAAGLIIVLLIFTIAKMKKERRNAPYIK